MEPAAGAMVDGRPLLRLSEAGLGLGGAIAPSRRRSRGKRVALRLPAAPPSVDSSLHPQHRPPIAARRPA